MMEKQFNKKVKSKIFGAYEDAKFFQLKYGGETHFIKQYEQTATIGTLDRDVEDPDLTLNLSPTGKCLFILNLSAECSLNNGFRYIKELLLQHRNFYLNNCWKLLREHGVSVYTVKTDSFTTESSHLWLVEQLLNWETGIGSWCFSRSDDINFPDSSKLLEVRENTFKPLRSHPVRPTQLKDEWGMDAVCNQFEEKRRVMIRAEFAGCGKSYACEQMKSHRLRHQPARLRRLLQQVRGLDLLRFHALQENKSLKTKRD